ncbi:putative transcription factor bZIP family [Helianthus annuus]|uniref:protein CYCLOPS isoform X2 n=1 Tax=Helianthus annuus TaxID=4232 RepID=UPI000B8F2860|nr:protein CYCLOPS isoform X2 [Helianthus annuus]KAJ0770376.1 putative transcription factor bZIP family [Helianthus annuus]KAJ0907276.1 putative transcription factor bZIP family [Helianthus annuus]
MINNGTKGDFIDNSYVNNAVQEQKLSTTSTGETGKGYMEMEGRVYSDLYRNSSEDMFIRTLMESSVGMPSPTMEMLGFKNLSNNFRADSEELFKNWLTTAENPTSLVHNRSRQLSRMMLTDQATLSNHQNGGSIEQRKSNENLPPQSSMEVGESSNDSSIRNVAERGLQASNLYLAKAWFHSSQPMTRSRSSELRRRYVAMQNSQTAIGMEAMHNASGSRVNQLKQESANHNSFNEASLYDIPNQLDGFMPHSNSSSSIDKVSSVVSMLKGTLERKKLSNHIAKEAVEDGSLGYYNGQHVFDYSNLNHMNEIHDFEVQETVQDPRLFQTVQGPLDADLDNFVAPTNQIQMSFASREPSQSESSAAAPVISSGFDVCDGPTNSGQAPTKGTDTKEQMHDNLQEDRKRKNLIRFGSVTSAASVDSRDPTKKRRVERSRKMAEAKGRTQTPATSSDMQSMLKRCENLEKEVRSLKLNLAFMNRKDSEQTKQIEELQKQNEEMRDEKERLLEEIERILSEPDKM